MFFRTSKLATSQVSRRAISWVLVIGPGVLGLVADNDAGGMLSYLVTGAEHHLAWFFLGLIGMAPITYLIQEVALRSAIATQMPYSHLIQMKFGRTWTAINGTVMHLLNALVLVTEFLGMTSALHLIGMCWWGGLLVSYTMVVGVTSCRQYLNLERLLLIVATLNLSFVPVLFFLHPTSYTWHVAWGHGFAPSIFFLELSLAGNAISPWMIYWQQNAVWSGRISSLEPGRKDLLLGVVAQVVMAGVVLFIGGLAKGRSASLLANPLVWLSIAVGKIPGQLFAVGVFDAGFLAACTISLSSAWMLSEALNGAVLPRDVTPTTGRFRWVHLITVTFAMLGVLIPTLPIGSIGLWVQALGAIWMPVSILMLTIIARDVRLMGEFAISRFRLVALMGAVVLFGVLAIMSVAS